MIGQADWLTGERARAYGGAIWLAGLALTAGFYWLILQPAWSDPHWRVAATDFDAFWAGAQLAWHGHPADAYTPQSMQAAELLATQPAGGSWFPYLYPPIFLLLTLPLGGLPYLAALATFLLIGYAIFSACLHCIIPVRWSWLPILLSPAALTTAVIGQNGFLTASCFAGGLLLMGRSPLFGGMCLGLLIAKPHLAIGIPVALLAARRWRALSACALTAAWLTGVSWAVLGSAVWSGFFSASSMMRAMIESPLVWPKLASVYGAARVLHAGVPLAAALQGFAAVVALMCLGRLVWRRPGAAAEVAALVPTALLCTPFLWDYDLVCLGVPMAWIAARAGETGWRRWEKLLLLALYGLPAIARTANLSLGVPLTPPLAAALLAIIVIRVRSTSHTVPSLS